ncbi:fungal transcriptional regulatory protein [Ophiostoma piceae UAMH 11346]|uniref:Fungal transcriptional regulatory protein n=1 Tax=Ophiostoma piceae (strain UAMH 11346) TaxID=1262450 RepID=S3C8M5_OPHP1|nr:fungal transcriptional regulatory protein [Ophiostoma piceae UAMH 11346]
MATHSTVDRLLSRIGETAERDQVVAALLNFAGATQNTHQEAARHRGQQKADQLQPGTAAASGSSHSHSSPRSNVYDNTSNPHSQHTQHLSSINTSSGGGTPTVVNTAEHEFLASLVSPLHIMAAAITADTAPYHRSQNSPLSSSFLSKASNKNLIDDRLSRYFATTQTTHQKDWQVLATQPIDSPLKLETSTCDPVAARLIDQDDVDWYFKLFFKYRNPLIGLLDPLLHTPEYVHETSFVLFSALCSLGCAVSDRPRDRVVYPALQSLAEGNMKWSIAVCVKSLEVVQSIIVMQYWAPTGQRQSDDPYWLRLSHAVQLARELGIHRPATIAEQVNTRARGTSPEFKERLFRNFERTWLYTFISDKSFGIITGRSMGVAWKEIPPSASEWWRKPQTGPVDRIVSGIVEFRGYFLNAMEQRKRVDNTLQAIEEWHGHTYRILDQTRNNRCGPQNNVPQSPASSSAEPSTSQPPGGYYLPVLAFYMDHSIMVLNAQALRDMIAIDQTGSSPELLHLSALNVDIASRLLDTMLHNEVLLELQVGYHNNQLIMVCHAATEILYAIQRGGLSLIKVDQAAAKVRAIPGHLERIAARLPSTSPAHLYASLSGFFVCQLDKVVRNNAERYGASVANSTANTDDRSTAGSETSNNNSATNNNDNAGSAANHPAEGDMIAAGEVASVVHHQQQASSSSSRAQLDRVVEPDQDSLLADWWKTVDGGLLDSTTWMDMGFLSSEQPILGSNNGGDPQDMAGSYQMF